MSKDTFINGAIELIIGLILMPILAGFIYFAGTTNLTNASGVGAYGNASILSHFAGMIAMLTIVGYAFAFGLIYAGIKTIKGA